MNNMSESDWNTIIIRSKKLKHKEEVKKAQRNGTAQIDTKKKFEGGRNTCNQTNVDIRKIEDETEDFNIKKVNRKLSTTISKARTAKGMKQKELATKINVLPALIQKYENGQAIPDQQVINKLQRVLGIKLTGKDFK
jgi:putative transcription factor